MTKAKRRDRLARRPAAKRSRGRQFDNISVFADFIDDRPEALLDTIDAVAAQIAGADDVDDLDQACLALLSMQFEQVRYRIESGDHQARDLKGEAERRVGALVRDGVVPMSFLAVVTAAMREARLDIGPDLRALSEEVFSVEMAEPTPSSLDLDRLFSEMAAVLGDDAFAAVDTIAQGTCSLPPHARATMTDALLAGSEPALREAAALLLLDQEPPVRRSAATALARHAELLSPVTLRRLIALRTWMPESERHLVDQAVREARLKGIEPAQWAEVSAATDIRASMIDGAGAQALLVVYGDGRKRRFASILIKDGIGIADAVGPEPISARELSQMLSFAEIETGHRPVPRSYLDHVVCHNLAAGLEVGRLPPAALLRVAEELGATEWRPARIDWRKALDAVLARSPAATDSSGVEQTIATSADWAAAAVALESWFEDGPDVRAIVGRAGRRLSPTVVGRVVQEVIDPRRLKWAQRFADVAVWLEAGDDPAAAGKFAIIARELADGRPARQIPLMVDIALRTIEAARQ